MAWSGKEIIRINRPCFEVKRNSPGWPRPRSSSAAGAQLSSSSSYLRQVAFLPLLYYQIFSHFSPTFKLWLWSNCRDYSQGRTVADRFSMFGQSVIVQMSVSKHPIPTNSPSLRPILQAGDQFRVMLVRGCLGVDGGQYLSFLGHRLAPSLPWKDAHKNYEAEANICCWICWSWL